MKLEKKYIVLSIIAIAILFGSVTYAFFKANIIGEGKEVSLKSKGIYLIYNGELDIASGYIEPGWSMTKTFTVENQGDNTETYDIYIKDLVNTFETKGYLQYKITSTNGYNMANYEDIPKSAVATDTVLAYSVSIEPSTTHTYTIELIYSNTTEDQSADMGKTLSGTLNIKEGTLPTLYEKILADNPTISTRTDFSVTNVADTTGTIYSTTATEDGSTVHYYSGNTTNNWVYFGGFYWRIIRTNEDGSVRILYSGTSPDTTEGYIGTSKYNTSYNSPMYVGYMYGTSGSLASNRTNTNDSTIKQIIDTWYENNLLTNYDKYISREAIYCNDRSIGSGTYSTSTSSTFYYGAYTRLLTNKTPTYKCGGNTSGGLFESTQAVEDKFSVSTSGGGNGQLKYPIALMTADEVAYAGGKYNTSLSSPYAWYYTNSTGGSITADNFWWTMAPLSWVGSDSNVWRVGGSYNPGYLGNGRVDYSGAVRPSVSLKSCNLISEGDGTASNPYKINYEESCTE